MIKFFPAGTTDFSKLGILGVKALWGDVYEEINGAYTLSLTIPRDEERIEPEMIVCAPTPKNGMQPFRIYMPIEPTGDVKKLEARQIFYDLDDNFLEDCRGTSTGANALNHILESTQFPHPFTATSTITDTSVAYWEMMSPVQAILGAENSLVNRWGGEIERDGFSIHHVTKLGRQDGSVTKIRYGKNLQAFQLQTDYSNIVTRIYPTGLKEDGQTVLKLPEKYVDSQLIGNYPHPKVKRIHYSDVKVGTGEGEFATEAAAQAELRRRAAEEFANGADVPQVSGEISILELSKYEEYKDLSAERLYLGDKIDITNITTAPITARIVAYHYDPISEVYTSIEVGADQQLIASSIRKSIVELAKILQNSTNFLEQTIEEQTELLTSALGGYVLKRKGEILIMDTEDPSTCTQCWRFNLNGLGYSSTGYNGPYTTAITMDGRINASLITAGEFDGAYIKAGSITADKIAVGAFNSGYNKLRNSSFERGVISSGSLSGWTETVYMETGGGPEAAPDMSVRQSGGFDNRRHYRFDATSCVSLNEHNFYGLENNTEVFCVGNQHFIISAYIRLSALGGDGQNIIIKAVYYNENTRTSQESIYKIRPTKASEWDRVYQPIVTPEGTTSFNVGIFCNSFEGETFDVDGAMVEEGDILTGWTPHPYEIINANTVIDDEGIKVYNGKITVYAGAEGTSQKYFSVENNVLYIWGLLKSIAYPNISVGIGQSETGNNGALTVTDTASGYGDIFSIYRVATENEKGVVITSPFLTNANGTNRKGLSIFPKTISLFNDSIANDACSMIQCGGTNNIGCSIGVRMNTVVIGCFNTNNRQWINYYAPLHGGAKQEFRLGNGTQGGYANLWVGEMSGNTFVLRNASNNVEIDTAYLMSDGSIGIGDYSKARNLMLYGNKLFFNDVEVTV